MFRAVSTRIRSTSAAALICVLQGATLCHAGSILHRHAPKPAAPAPQAGVIVVPQPAPMTYVYTLPGNAFLMPWNPVPAAPAAPAAEGADPTVGVDLEFANEVSALAADPQYRWLAGRLGGDPARVKALKDHLRVVLHREMRRQGGRVQSVNWPKFLENAAIIFLKVTYAFNVANPWEPALAIVQRLINDILQEEGLVAPANNCPPPAPPAPPAAPADPDPAPAPSPALPTTRARIIGTVELEIVDPSPDLTPAPAPLPTPAPAPPPAPPPAPVVPDSPAKPTPDAPDSLPEPLPQNNDAAPPPSPTP